MFEFNIVFSEVYQTPVLYFLIYDTRNFKIIDLDMQILNNTMINSCEFSKDVVKNLN
jgi:hypothetical protein